MRYQKTHLAFTARQGDCCPMARKKNQDAVILPNSIGISKLTHSVFYVFLGRLLIKQCQNVVFLEPETINKHFTCAVDIINCEVQVVTMFVFVDTNQQSPTLVIKPFYCLKPANVLLSRNRRGLKQGGGYYPVKADCFYGVN